MVRTGLPLTWFRAAAFLVLMSSPPVRGGSPSEVPITWPEIASLVEAHPRIAAALQRFKAAQAAVDTAGSVQNPSLEASGAYGRSQETSGVEWGLKLSIPFGWIAPRSARLEAARAEAQAAEADARAVRREVLHALRVLFWNLVYEQERVQTLTALSQQTDALAKAVSRRVAAGESRPVEATRVAVEAERVASELALARASQDARRGQLGLWIGLRPDKVPKAVGDLAELARPAASPSGGRGRAKNPAVAAAEARVQARLAALAVERRARVPAFSFEAFTDRELDKSAYGIGLQVDLPLWNWNTGPIAAAEAALVAEREQARAERLELEAAAIAATSACRAGIELSTRYRERIIKGAENAAHTIERTYTLGEASLLELIDVRRTLLETETQYLGALVQAQSDCSLQEELAGDLP